MKLPRRTFLKFAGAAMAAPAFSRTVTAGTYPSRPITMIVPFAAGGPTDAIARVIAEHMRGSLGQPVIIENVSGGEGIVGTGRAARATPDGYTIELGLTSTHVLNGALYSLPYDTSNDFAPVAPLAATIPFLLSRKTMPAKDVNDLVAWLKANPNKASAGVVVSSYRLVNLLFQKETGTQFTLVPYRGNAPALQDLVAGQIDLLVSSPEALPLVRTGSVKAYAVISDTRSALAPDIPTLAEMGLPTIPYAGFFGIFAPRGTPKDIIDRLNAATVAALADPVVRPRFADIGVEIYPREQQTPEALGALQKAQIEKWWPVIRELGIRAE